MQNQPISPTTSPYSSPFYSTPSLSTLTLSCHCRI